MGFWKKEDLENTEMWYDEKKNVIAKEEKVIVKLRDNNDTFLKSIIMPTDYYPLNDKYQTFTVKNTEEVTDKKLLAIFDEIKYEVGRCYTNSTTLYEKLTQAGYDAKTYCGWLFVGQGETPIHHCWVMVGNSILDLSDDMTVFTLNYRPQPNDAKEGREKFMQFHKDFLHSKNSERCFPVGTPTPSYLYVGCECSPSLGRNIYNQMMRKFPNHECEANCNSKGENMTQIALREIRK